MAYIGKRPQDTFPAGNAVTATTIAENAVGSSEIATNAVTTLQIADNAVTGVKIAENGITSRELAANTIATGNIADNAIDSTKIAQNSILTKHIDDGQVTTDQILDGTIATGDLADDAVTTAKITDANVTTAKIADSNVTTAKIADDAVTTAKMASLARGAILVGDASGNPSALALGSNGLVLKSDGSDLVFAADSGLSSEQVQDIVGAMFSSNTETGITGTYQDSDGTIDLVVGTLNQDTTGNAATATALETGRTVGMTGDVVWTSASFDGSGNVTGAATIQANAVESAMIAENNITSRELAANTIATGNIADNAVDGTKIAQNSILTKHIDDAQVTTDQLGADAVTAAKLADDAVVTANITDANVTTAKIADDAVTAAKLADTAVTAASYGSGSAIPVITVDAQGRITAASTAATSSTLTIAADSGSNDTVTVGTDTLTFEGTANEISTTVSNNKINVALPDNVVIGGNLTVTGDYTVNGSTSTNSVTNMVISDNLIELNNGAGSNANDSGLVIERGSTGDNAIFMWDESADKFVVGTTTATGASTGNLTVTTGTLVANVEGAVTGNASTATALANARTIHGVSFDGTANIDLSEVVQDTVGTMFSSNTETGITATYQDSDGTIDLVVGTLNQDTTGLAGTATALATARTIHGVSFDGTANIDLSEVVQDTVGAMFSSNTETGITATYEDSDGTIDLVVGTLNQNTTGSAATLTTARNIGGVSFDGSANIDLPGVNSAGNQNTTGSAATLTTARAIAVAGAVTGTANFDGSAGISISTTLANNAVLTQHIDDNQITSDQIADDAVGADQLAANSVVSASIVNGSIVSADIAANTIATSNVADNAIDATKIASNSILTRHIDDNQITGDQIADDIVLSGTGAIRMPDGTTAQRPGSAAAGMFRYNTTDGKFEGYTDSWGEIGGGGSNGFLTDIFDGTTTPATDGSRVAFTMSQAVTDEKFVMVFIDGVYQNHAAYSVSGTTLTMADAPVAGRVLTVHTVSAAVQGDGLTINNFSGDGSDTTFTLNVDPTHENNTQVYIDGVYQFKNTYSVSGTTLTFSTAPPNGSGIEVMVHSQTTINSAGSLAAGAVSGLSEVTIAGADHLMLFDATDNALKKGLASDLIEQLTTEQVQDVVGAMVSSNTETGVAVSYEDGDGTLDFVLASAQPTVTSLGTLTALTVDDITINGSTISDSGILTITAGDDFSVDAEGDISLDANGGDIRFKDNGTVIGEFTQDSNNFVIKSAISDEDLIFKGNDGGSTITALTLDMSDAGSAYFNNRVGIGTTSPDCDLHINGATNSEQVIITGGNNASRGLSISTVANNGQSDAGVIFNAQDTENASYPALIYQTGGSERMRIDGSGKVGIATTSPSTALDIAASTNSTNSAVYPVVTVQNTAANSDNSYAALNVKGGNGQVNGFILADGRSSANVFSIRTETATPIQFNTDGSERMRIDSSGRLLLGTTIVGIDGSSSGTGVVLRDNASSLYTVDSDDVMALNRLGTDGTILRFRNDGTSVGTISTGSNSLPSDRNFKRDIEDLEIGLDLIKKLKPSQYNYKIQDDDAPKLYGLIAQDLEQSLAEVGVEKNSTSLLQHNPNDDEKESDYDLDYLKLTPVLINAIQEQQTLIETQQTTINDLKSRIETLEG